MVSKELTAIGWTAHFQQQLGGDEPADIVPARVMNVHRSGLQLLGESLNRHV